MDISLTSNQKRSRGFCDIFRKNSFFLFFIANKQEKLGSKQFLFSKRRPKISFFRFLFSPFAMKVTPNGDSVAQNKEKKQKLLRRHVFSIKISAVLHDYIIFIGPAIKFLTTDEHR